MTIPGAIIMGNEYQALGLLQQLRAVGLPCALVDQDALGVARFSRHSVPFHCSPRYNSDQFWPWLVALARQRGYQNWMLILTDDEQVRQVGLHYQEATHLFRYLGPSWEIFQTLYDKRALYQWTRTRGIQSPISFLPQSRADRPGAELPYPFIVKPAYKRNFSNHTKAKAIVVASEAELAELLDGTLRGVEIEELLYQEIIPGNGESQWSYAGLFLRGEPVAAFTACRRRQHPPDFGRASTYVIAEHDPEVERESRRVMKELRYSGLAEVEWKRDPRDGRLRFLEVNARCWGWHSLALPVMGNLPKLLIDVIQGTPVAPIAPTYGWRWVKHITDLPVVMQLCLRGEMRLSDYAASLRGRVVSPEWGKGDPLPFFLQFALIPYLLVKRGY